MPFEYCSAIVAAEKHDVVRKANRNDESENMPGNNHFGLNKIYCHVSPVAGKYTGVERYLTRS